MAGTKYLVRSLNPKRKMTTFQVTAEDHEKIDNWLRATVYPAILERQKKDPDLALHLIEDEQGYSYPYFGAAGGALTYEFTQTSIGTVLRVRCDDQVLDLTDYESW